jgi:hypothetical protein
MRQVARDHFRSPRPVWMAPDRKREAFAPEWLRSADRNTQACFQPALRTSGPAGKLEGIDSNTSRRPGPERIQEPGRIELMSAQRRENRRKRITGAGVESPPAPQGNAAFGGRTAPPGKWARLATNSLQVDRRFKRPERNADTDDSRGAPRCASSRISQFSRSSPSHISSSSAVSPFHSDRPQIPAGVGRRAERYDGKRDLYFLNAA